MRINTINTVSFNNRYSKPDNHNGINHRKPPKFSGGNIPDFTEKEAGKQTQPEKNIRKMPAFIHSFLLNSGQKRAQKLEAQAKVIKEDAMDAIGFSYVGELMHGKQIIIDGTKTGDDTKTISKIYEYRNGELVRARLCTVENLKTGGKNIKQIFEFEGGKLSAVYEDVTKAHGKTEDFSRKYMADEKGHLQCVYNKIF